MEKKDIIFNLICVVLIFIFGSIVLKDFVFYERIPVTALPADQYPVYNAENVYEYYREDLSEDSKVIYDTIKEALLQFKPKVTIPVKRITTEQSQSIFQLVIMDHPEIFWVHGIKSYNNFVTGTITTKTVSFDYTYTMEEAQNIKEKIEPKIQSIVSEAEKLHSDYEKVKFVHDELIRIGNYNSDYTDAEEPRYQSIIEIFDTGNTVCAGFSEGFKLIMDRLGINAIEIKSINEENEDLSHIWNMVKVNNEWKNLDITYDNQGSNEKEIKRTYFLVDNIHFYINHEKPDNLPTDK